MNLTEAHEWVLEAAEAMIARGLAGKACVKPLTKAITKVKPRVQRMRTRLDAIRASKTGKPTCPKWAMP